MIPPYNFAIDKGAVQTPITVGLSSWDLFVTDQACDWEGVIELSTGNFEGWVKFNEEKWEAYQEALGWNEL